MRVGGLKEELASKDDNPNVDDLPYPEHIANDPGLKWLYTPHEKETKYNKYLGIDRDGNITVRCRRTGRIGYLIATVPARDGKPISTEEMKEHLLDIAVEDEMRRRHGDDYSEPRKGTA